jgi:hypothetical protein
VYAVVIGGLGAQSISDWITSVSMDRDTDALLIYHEDICVCVHIELLSQNDILTV